MKEQVQELHRDITRRKCLSKKEAVTDILDECSQVEITDRYTDGNIGAHEDCIPKGRCKYAYINF